MKTLPLRTLLRDPLRVKKITSGGAAVQITDKGKPLWELRPIEKRVDQDKREREIDEVLDATLREPMCKISLSKLVLDSRR